MKIQGAGLVTVGQSPYIWDRLEKETDAAWSAFCRYRDYPQYPRPPLVEWHKRNSDLKINTLQHWSARYKWSMRIQAFDKTRVTNNYMVRTLEERRSLVKEDEFFDYSALRRSWLLAYMVIHTRIADCEDPEEMASLVKVLNTILLARTKLQDVARLSVEMPKSYSAIAMITKKIKDDIDEVDVYLDPESGPGVLPEQVEEEYDDTVEIDA